MIWHPFTRQLGEGEPLKIVRGQGEYLYDATGKKLIDAIASWWTVIHGHNHPHIVEAIRRQLETLDHVMLAGFTHENAEVVAYKLLAISDKIFERVFFSDNGSTAVEVMLKLALQYWHNLAQPQKQEIIHFSSAYHGDTVGAMSVAGSSLFNAPFSSLLFHSPCFKYPCKEDDPSLEELERYLKMHSNETAAIIVEPLIAAVSGMQFQESDALKRIEDLARRFDVLLLFDEVFTGMGRVGSGNYFAYQKSATKPDIIAVAKGLTGGALPLAATLVNEKVYREFLSDEPLRAFYHGHTMTGNPLGCAAAVASLELFEKEDRLKGVMDLETHMRALWNSIAIRHGDKISAPRSMGAVSAADVNPRSEKSGYTFSASLHFREMARKQGVILRPLGNVLYVTPPYNISKEALEAVFDVLDELLTNYAD